MKKIYKKHRIGSRKWDHRKKGRGTLYLRVLLDPLPIFASQTLKWNYLKCVTQIKCYHSTPALIMYFSVHFASLIQTVILYTTNQHIFS